MGPPAVQPPNLFSRTEKKQKTIPASTNPGSRFCEEQSKREQNNIFNQQLWENIQRKSTSREQVLAITRAYFWYAANSCKHICTRLIDRLTPYPKLYTTSIPNRIYSEPTMMITTFANNTGLLSYSPFVPPSSQCPQESHQYRNYQRIVEDQLDLAA